MNDQTYSHFSSYSIFSADIWAHHAYPCWHTFTSLYFLGVYIVDGMRHLTWRRLDDSYFKDYKPCSIALLVVHVLILSPNQISEITQNTMMNFHILIMNFMINIGKQSAPWNLLADINVSTRYKGRNLVAELSWFGRRQLHHCFIQYRKLGKCLICYRWFKINL